MNKNSEFRWSLVYNTAGDSYSKDTCPTFSHLIFSKGQPVSPYWDLFTGAVLTIIESTELPFNNLIRVKIGLITKRDKKIQQGPHVDYHEPHKTILFYFNNTDGNSIIYNEKYNPVQPEPAQFSIMKSVKPNANTAVAFDGWQYHSSSSPIKSDARIVMNINFN